MASTIGVRVWMGTMPLATRNREVCAAITASVIKASAPEASAAHAVS